MLTRNRIFYVACRVAFLRVFDSLLDEFIASNSEDGRVGYLDRVPMLAGTAPQVQIELLLKTWSSLRNGERRELTVEEQGHLLRSHKRTGGDECSRRPTYDSAGCSWSG